MERRAATRHRVLRAGTILIGDDGSINCMVRNMSNTGAMLNVRNKLTWNPRALQPDPVAGRSAHVLPCHVAGTNTYRCRVRVRPPQLAASFVSSSIFIGYWPLSIHR
jgi:hypothetical protein